MPKVDATYFKEKQEKILAAAMQVCQEKPIYFVTMKDIVAQSGLSPGAVYQSFGSIEEVFAGILQKADSESDYAGEIQAILQSGKAPQIVLLDLFHFGEVYFSDCLMAYNKVLFELSLYATHAPEKRKIIYQQACRQSVYAQLGQALMVYVGEQVQAGYFQPQIPLEDLFAFVTAAFDGIVRDVTLTKYYLQEDEMNPMIQFDAEKLIHSLYLSTLALLGMPGCNTREE